MDKEIIFMSVIALFAFGFCLTNIASFLINRSHSKETQGTIISFRTINPSTEKMRNSKWATVSYNVAGKNYISQNQEDLDDTDQQTQWKNDFLRNAVCHNLKL